MLYTRDDGNCTERLYAMDVFGGNDHLITSGFTDESASALPDGRIVFSRMKMHPVAGGCSGDFAAAGIYIANGDGSGIRKLATIPTSFGIPGINFTISADGAWLLYENRNATAWYRIGLNGTNNQRVPFLDGAARAVWSKTMLCTSAANSWAHRVVNGFSTPSGNGYWLTYADGTVTTHGDAPYRGGAACLPLAQPIVGGASHPSGTGYWLVALDGGIFTYGTASFFGSMGAAHLNQPVFSMAATKTGKGYWLVARDGGIFSFGNAHFYGSMGGTPLNQPIAGITTSPTGHGYRMVARDGGIFSFGDVRYFGSLPALGIHVSDVVGMAPTPSGNGYWVVRANGQAFAFGDARYFANASPSSSDPITAIFSNPKAQGYRLVTASGVTLPFGVAPR